MLGVHYLLRVVFVFKAIVVELSIVVRGAIKCCRNKDGRIIHCEVQIRIAKKL